MTYILGWKNATSVFIHGDSIVTEFLKSGHDQLKEEETTSFGERVYIDSEKVIRKETLKIYGIDNRLVIAFAGNESTGLSVIRNIKLLVKHSDVLDREVVRGIINQAIQSVSPPQPSIQLILGFLDSGTPILMSFNQHENRQLIEHEEFADIGSLSSKGARGFSNLVRNFLTKLGQHSSSDDEKLIGVTCFLQNLGLTNYLVQFGVGGFFVGLKVNEKETTWLKDILYVIYDSSILPDTQHVRAPFHTISFRVRDDGIFLKSSFSKNPRIYLDSVNIKSPKAWIENWVDQDKLNSIANKIESDYYAFLCSEKLIITLIEDEVKDEFIEFTDHRVGKKQTVVVSGKLLNTINPNLKFSPNRVAAPEAISAMENPLRFILINAVSQDGFLI